MAGGGREIERKFLVVRDRLPPLPRGRRLVQGYLAQQPTVRVRIADDEAPDAKAWLTIKGPGLIDRPELEYTIPVDDARVLLGMAHAKLAKTRHEIEHAGKVWELDVFEDSLAGLLLAEIELSTIDEPFEPPAWVGREVSADPRYTNGALARGQRIPDA
jgi:CYTH domain-containing protein